MTKLEFRFEELVLDDVSDVPEHLFRSLISETLFFVPVKLLVNGDNVFQFSTLDKRKVEWIELPSFSLIIDLEEKLGRVTTTGREKFFLADAGEMVMSYNQGIIEVRTNINNLEAHEDYVSFHAGITAGLEDLRHYLKSKAPEAFEKSLRFNS